ncbi:MAG: hypothetical protein RR053_06375 [Evtepia sp.]
MNYMYRGMNNERWVYGDYYKSTSKFMLNEEQKIRTSHNIVKDGEYYYEVSPETVCEYSGVGNIWEHDILEIWGKSFEVIKQCGSFGIVSNDLIDYDLFENKIKEYTGCDNSPHFCGCDNFISLWELYWNYNEEENNLLCAEITGNIFDNLNWSEENK